METGYTAKHWEDHVCCLAGGERGPNYVDRAQEFMDSIIPIKDLIAFPGLNTHKLFAGHWRKKGSNVHFVKDKTSAPATIPSGRFHGQTVHDAVRTYRSSPYAALIYGSNNRFLFDETFSLEQAVSIYIQEIRKLFEGSSIDVIFVSTIFPRRIDVDAVGKVISQVENFNNFLLSPKMNLEKYQVKVRDSLGRRKVIKIRIVDMTKVLNYSDMCDKNMYCARKPDYVHVRGWVLERYLERLEASVTEYTQKSGK